MRSIVLSLLAITALLLVGCSTEPRSEAKREALGDEVQSTLRRMKSLDSSLQQKLDDAYGYVIFPEVGKGGFIVGGSYGRGQVFEQGNLIGYADITQATVGLQAGGQTFSELILFKDKQALDNFRNGKLKLTANASAVALKSGAAAAAEYRDGVAVLVEPRGGLMAEASIGGQSFSYVPLAEGNKSGAEK
jgi:lipid-binding SYLF domain-containing protein